MSEANVTANGTVVRVPRDLPGGRKPAADFVLEINPSIAGAQDRRFQVRVIGSGGLADDLMREIEDGDRVLVHGFLNQDRRDGSHYIHAINVALELKGLRGDDDE